MTKNPLINATLAILYIVFIAVFMFYGLARSHPDNSVFAPIAFISLFTLSAASMAYIFLYYPLLLLIDGHKKESLNLFLKTLAIFAAITTTILLLIFSGVV